MNARRVRALAQNETRTLAGTLFRRRRGRLGARRGLRALTFLVAWTLPAIALACPVCGQAQENQRLAYIISTGFMSFLPLLFIAGVIYWLVRKARAADAEQRLVPHAEQGETSGDSLGTEQLV